MSCCALVAQASTSSAQLHTQLKGVHQEDLPAIVAELQNKVYVCVLIHALKGLRMCCSQEWLYQ